MASCTAKEWVSYSPNAKLTVTQSSSTDTTVTLAWKLQYITDTADPAYTNGIGRTWSVTIDGTKVKSGTYNINLVHGTNTVDSGTTTVNKTKSTRNVSFSLSFEFDITWNNVYCDTLTASSSISIAAKTSYTVSYNANGGSGAPSNQTKWHGESLTLSSTKPTRTGYTFAGWGSSADDTTPINQPGGTYTGNAKYTYSYSYFINKLTAITELTFDFPVFSEWHYAAIGGDKTQAYVYSGSNIASNVAWYSANSDATLHDVKQLQPNELGFYDMSGNACEYVRRTSTSSYVEYVGGYYNSSIDQCKIFDTYGSYSGYSSYCGLRLILRIKNDY